jgi:hypothetical protein
LNALLLHLITVATQEPKEQFSPYEASFARLFKDGEKGEVIGAILDLQ